MTAAARYTLIATILGSSIAFIDGSVVNVALPAIQHDLGGGLAAQQWVVDGYLLTLGSLILVGGSLGDILGEVKMFRLGVASFGVASVLCAVAPDSTTLIVFRGVQGVAGALLTPASLAVITSTFSGAARGAAIGQWTAWSGISFVIGPLFGGWLIGISSWRLIFVINVPIAIATLLLTLTFARGVRETRRDAPVDFAGAALCAAGLGLVVAGFIEQPHLGWSDPLVSGGLAGGVALLALFVGYELRASAPMLPLRLFRLRNFSVTNVETFAVYGALSGWSVFLTLFQQEFSGYSPLHAGLATLPVTIVMFFLSPRTGRLSMRYGIVKRVVHRASKFRDYLPVAVIIVAGGLLTAWAGDQFLDLAEMVHSKSPALQKADTRVHDLEIHASAIVGRRRLDHELRVTSDNSAARHCAGRCRQPRTKLAGKMPYCIAPATPGRPRPVWPPS